MSSVALKKGVEEPRTIKRVVKFIDLLGCREITLKSDTEPAIIAFRNRVAAMCKAEVTMEDAAKGELHVVTEHVIWKSCIATVSMFQPLPWPSGHIPARRSARQH